MNSYLTPQNIALSVVYLRNSRAITYDIRLDGEILRRNLLRPELISASLGQANHRRISRTIQNTDAADQLYLSCIELFAQYLEHFQFDFLVVSGQF